jgi:hypothetical protein
MLAAMLLAAATLCQSVHTQRLWKLTGFQPPLKPLPWAFRADGHKGENAMKTMISMFALALAIAFAAPAFAGDVTTAKTAADCAKAGGMWDAKTNKCTAKKM